MATESRTGGGATGESSEAAGRKGTSSGRRADRQLKLTDLDDLRSGSEADEDDDDDDDATDRAADPDGGAGESSKSTGRQQSDEGGRGKQWLRKKQRAAKVVSRMRRYVKKRKRKQAAALGSSSEDDDPFDEARDDSEVDDREGDEVCVRARFSSVHPFRRSMITTKC